MIIKMKTGKYELNGLESNFIEKKNGKLTFRVEAGNLNSFLDYLHKNGIFKVKVKLEKSDNFGKDKSVSIKTKPTQIEYYEEVLAKELKQLRENKDVLAFFNSIKFVDEEHILFNIYKYIIKNVNDFEKCGDLAIKSAKFNEVFETLFSKCDEKEKKRIKNVLRNNFKSWLQENHGDYKEYFSKSLPWTGLLYVILKHTGYEYC